MALLSFDVPFVLGIVAVPNFFNYFLESLYLHLIFLSLQILRLSINIHCILIKHVVTGFMLFRYELLSKILGVTVSILSLYQGLIRLLYVYRRIHVLGCAQI